MSKLRDAISQVPSKPGFALAAVAALGIGAWFYGTTWQRCSELKTGRAELLGKLHAAVNSATRQFSFSQLAGMQGIASIRIARAHKPGKAPLNCPFGWDMTWRERQTLIEAGKYTIIGLFDDEGQFQRYIEWNDDLADFSKVPKEVGVSAPLKITGTLDGAGRLMVSPFE